MATLKRWIFFLGLTTQGSMHDYELLKEELNWYGGKKTGSICSKSLSTWAIKALKKTLGQNS